MKHFTEVKYFHPSGKECPDQTRKTFWMRKCLKNRESFDKDIFLHYNDAECKHCGGMIVFSFNAEIDNKSGDYIYGLIEQFPTKSQFEYDLGHDFTGKYVSERGIFNELSITIDVNGMGTDELIMFAGYMSDVLGIEGVLVNDFNEDKIYILD